VLTKPNFFTINNKIIHNANTGTFLQFPSNDNFTITTGGVERVRVLPNGNVGIRTSAPLTPLHVEGESTFSNNVNFNNPTPNLRRVINIREVTRNEILVPGTYDLDAIPVKSLRDFLFDDTASSSVASNWVLANDQHDRTYICTNTSNITITCPAGLRRGLQVSFIRAGVGEVTFINGLGASYSDIERLVEHLNSGIYIIDIVVYHNLE
jgi:hypothetical protein